MDIIPLGEERLHTKGASCECKPHVERGQTITICHFPLMKEHPAAPVVMRDE